MIVSHIPLAGCLQIFVVRLRKKGQITIPAKIREALNLKENQKLLVLFDGSRIIIEVPKNIPKKYLELDEDEVEFAILDRELVSYYYGRKYG